MQSPMMYNNSVIDQTSSRATEIKAIASNHERNRSAFNNLAKANMTQNKHQSAAPNIEMQGLGMSFGEDNDSNRHTMVEMEMNDNDE